MYNIAVMGYGTVGSGVLEVFYKNQKSIQRKAGCEMDIKYILEIREFPGDPYEDKIVNDFNTLLNDPTVKVVAEVMGGLHPAYDFTKALLENGKSVVTSNKELVSKKGGELLKIAREHNVNYLFEASVGGGIPIIRPLHQCLAANEIDEIEGILNGTTNFILTKMIHENMAFDEVLKLAQQLGYAEKDPTADVEGIDACRKICILASLAFGQHVYPDHIFCEGITKITPEDVQYAEDWGGVIKLIGRAVRLPNDKASVMVAPMFVPHESQLSTVDDVFNGILVRGDATGEVVFYGKGAGKLPTASAVVADIIDCMKAEGTIRSLRWNDEGVDIVEEHDKTRTQAYLRLEGGSEKEIREMFGEVRMLTREGKPAEEYALITPMMTEGELKEKREALEKKGIRLLAFIRLLGVQE